MLKNLKFIISFLLILGFFFPSFPQSADAHLYQNKYTHRQVADYVIQQGLKYRGVPYKFGASMSSAPYRFDCSSFTKYVFDKAGIYLPRTARAQANYGKYVSVSNLQRGDLLFFNVPGRSVTVGHVAIYMGNGKMLHTYGEGGVKVSTITRYWKNRYLGAKRMY